MKTATATMITGTINGSNSNPRIRERKGKCARARPSAAMVPSTVETIVTVTASFTLSSRAPVQR